MSALTQTETAHHRMTIRYLDGSVAHTCRGTFHSPREAAAVALYDAGMARLDIYRRSVEYKYDRVHTIDVKFYHAKAGLITKTFYAGTEK